MSARADPAAAAGASEGPTIGAILLAGGRAARMGGVAKPFLEVGGRTLLQRAIDACLAAACAPITVVGPPPGPAFPITVVGPAPGPPSPPGPHLHGDATRPATPLLPRAVQWTREDPPFSGPAAGVVAALATWGRGPEWAFVLACDLPRVDAAVGQLRHDMMLLPSDTDGMCLADGSSRPQWLAGIYRTDALTKRAAALGDGARNASMRALLDDLAIAVVEASVDIADVDTWADLAHARAQADRA